MKRRNQVLAIIIALILAGLYYYITLPAINIHNANCWKIIIAIPVIIFLIYVIPRISFSGDKKRPIESNQIHKTLAFKILVTAIVVLGVIYGAGSLLSSPIINASKYQKLLTVETGEFSEDIAQISYDQIPLLDRSSAEILGERKMGSLVDLASQFEVADLYTQSNYNDTPVRITPLKYASLIKWFTNRKDGIPAYIIIDMATQETNLVRLEEGMMYTPYDHFGRYLYRHLRFKYPTYMFDNFSFELDEEGTPYWICSTKKFNIGLFGGQTIGNVVICNAITGECQEYAIDEVPSWVDQVYSASLLVNLYDYYGTLKHGYINSLLSQRDCLATTNGYNYLAIDDDVWVYTGVTSITSDQSNVGFVLMNQRTMETKYYEIEGAIEDSAMSSAEGKVQNLGYTATFPLLLNIDSEPTYFMALKDASGLVKKYAMVNVQNYQIVATGDSVSECEATYVTLMADNGIETESDEEESASETFTVTGTIRKIAESVIDGNSHYYLLLDDSDIIYDVDVSDNLTIILYNTGDSITLEYTQGTDCCTVTGIVE
ncbi:MAG: CvpA family protein [Clostridiales bacterium]|nr:CvpA family protein [Clostridiales bacterium]